MSALGQRALVSNLVDHDALDLLAREGLDEECIPDERLRGVVAFALDYFHQSGRQAAPTVAVMREHYGDLLDDTEIEIGGAEETMEWAIDDLRATFVHKQASSFNKQFATDMAAAEIGDRVQVIHDAAADLVDLSLRMQSHEYAVDMREAMLDRARAYYDRKEQAGDHVVRGMGFGRGMERIDDWIGGIRDGEMAVVAAPAKAGKSFMLARVALNEWERGRAACLYTLENSVDMTLDRMACMETGIDPQRWERGLCTRAEEDAVEDFFQMIDRSDTPLWVLQPDEGQRTPEALVRGAQLRGADSLIVDQLTWVEHPNPRGLSTREIIGANLRAFRLMISTGRHRLPLLMAHQINREGMKSVDADGRLKMWHLAESSEVERAVDFAFGLYQGEAYREVNQTTLQMLAARRVDLKHWILRWNPTGDGIRVLQETVI